MILAIIASDLIIPGFVSVRKNGATAFTLSALPPNMAPFKSKGAASFVNPGLSGVVFMVQ